MINSALIERGAGVDVSGSLYAVATGDRRAAAHLLAERDLWVHADVFAGGVSLELIADLAGAWQEVPESSYSVIAHGEDDIHDFKPRPLA